MHIFRDLCIFHGYILAKVQLVLVCVVCRDKLLKFGLNENVKALCQIATVIVNGQLHSLFWHQRVETLIIFLKEI